jgi:signal transduction histidine kinase
MYGPSESTRRADARAHFAAGDRRGSWRSRSEELGTENRRKTEFMAVFSHELRNSLSVIRSAASVLKTGAPADPAVVKARLLIERQVGQMSRLVEDLLDFSRIPRGQLRLRRERLDLRTVVTHAVQTVELTMQQRNQRLTTSVPDSPVWLDGDSARLEQVLVNLLVNAAKYTDAGGDVALAIEREGLQAVLRIRDSGIGIAPDLLPQVFDLFVQADPGSPRADAGLGIGLAVVRSIVESHGGRVGVASAGVRQGSEFTVRLPMLTR